MADSTPSPSPLPRFHAYPDPREFPLPWTEPEDSHNPIVRGLPLHIGAKLVERFGFVAKYLYKNAGFGVLADLRAQLDGVECRYDPTVTPIEGAADAAQGGEVFRPAAEGNLRPPRPKGEKSQAWWSVADYAEAYRSGRTTPTEVVSALLPLIRRDVAQRHKHSTAFLASRVDLIEAAAAASTLRWKEGRPLGVLDGVPVAVKDEVDIKGYKKTYASANDYSLKKEGTSWCVAKWEEEGAIVVGKTNMHELGLDTTNLNPVHGTPLNPYNDHYYTGGSSGGSAYAVSAGLVPIALGVDGGGSIRIPSAYCGVYGLKTSHGRVSEAPTTSSANTNCVIGPMCADISSLEVAYRVMAAPDPRHTRSRMFPVPKPLSNPRTAKKLGLFKPWFDRADPEVKLLCENAIGYLTTKLGYEIIDITLPLLPEGQTAHAVTILNEGVAGLASWKNLSAANKILLAVGAQASAADFLYAQQLRGLLMSHLAFLFQQHPGLIIVTPVSPNPGWAIKSAGDLKYGCTDGDMSVRSMEYVWLANFTGCPCLNFPVGYTAPLKGKGTEDVPVGMMGMGEWGSEEELIAFGYDGEEYLHEGYAGGRRRPKGWTDVMALANGEEVAKG